MLVVGKWLLLVLKEIKTLNVVEMGYAFLEVLNIICFEVDKSVRYCVNQ